MLLNDEYYMRMALKQAVIAAEKGEVPVGAVAVRDGMVIGRCYNQVELLKDATAHAEMLVLTQASAAKGDWRLDDVTLYVTKEPCPMCAGAMINSRLKKLVFGLPDPKYGAAGSALNITGFDGLLHKVEVVSGLLEEECKAIIQSFFKDVRSGTVKKQKNL